MTGTASADSMSDREPVAGLPVPMDGASVTALHQDGTAYGWASPHTDYRVLSYELVDAVVDGIRNNAPDDDQHTAALSVAFDIYMEMQRVDRLAIDLDNIARQGANAIYTARDNPLLDHLETGSIANELPELAIELSRHRSPSADGERLKNRLRVWRREFHMRTVPRDKRCDLLARSPLLDNYVSEHGVPAVDLQPYLYDWPEPDPSNRAGRDLAAALVDAHDRLLADRVESPVIRERARAWAAAYAEERIARACADWNYLQRIPVEKTGAKTLLTGAPKDIGRLISARYQAAGCEVIRFTHGGERGFYDDYHWGLRELPFCDRYYAHSQGEAQNMESRLADGRTLSGTRNRPRFESLGSPRHAAIHESPPPADADPRRIMFVACSFLGERHSDALGAKLPDTLSLDLEIRACAALRSEGFEVTYKAHPKSMVDLRAIAGQMGDHIDTSSFDPIHNPHSCLVFDYAGSAFFDALASHRRVVLIDTGIRPLDANARQDIEARCRVVPTSVGPDNRLRLDTTALCDAIEGAPDDCSDTFFTKYFTAPK
jgi:hypothetical protein